MDDKHEKVIAEIRAIDAADNRSHKQLSAHHRRTLLSAYDQVASDLHRANSNNTALYDSLERTIAERDALLARNEALRKGLRDWLKKCPSCGGSGRELTWDQKGGPPMRDCTHEICRTSRQLLKDQP